MRLSRELEEIAKEFGIDFDDVTEMYAEVNCSKPNLKKLLEGQSFVRWKELEDMALKSRDPQQMEYLLKTKGQEEIEKRRAFLGISTV